MPAKVFVSYSSADAALANSIYVYLNGHAIHAVKAPDDIRPGEDWAGSITGMIEAASHMVLIWTSHSMASKEVAKELTLAMQSNTVIIPFQVQDLAPEGAWRYHLANLHWLQAYSTDHDSACRNLANQIQGITPTPIETSATNSLSTKASRITPRNFRGNLLLALIALVLSITALILNLVALVIGIWLGLTQPLLQASMATMIGGIYRGIPPLSMVLYLISVVAALLVLMGRSNRKALAIASIALTGIQLLAYAISGAAGILPR